MSSRCGPRSGRLAFGQCAMRAVRGGYARVLHPDCGVRVLGLQIRGHLGRALVPEPVVIVAPCHPVQRRGLRSLLGHERVRRSLGTDARRDERRRADRQRQASHVCACQVRNAEMERATGSQKPQQTPVFSGDSVGEVGRLPSTLPSRQRPQHECRCLRLLAARIAWTVGGRMRTNLRDIPSVRIRPSRFASIVRVSAWVSTSTRFHTTSSIDPSAPWPTGPLRTPQVLPGSGGVRGRGCGCRLPR
jgi:hypothetical protein